MDFYGFLWILMDFNCLFFWILMEFHGFWGPDMDQHVGPGRGKCRERLHIWCILGHVVQNQWKQNIVQHQTKGAD